MIKELIASRRVLAIIGAMAVSPTPLLAQVPSAIPSDQYSSRQAALGSGLPFRGPIELPEVVPASAYRTSEDGAPSSTRPDQRARTDASKPATKGNTERKQLDVDTLTGPLTSAPTLFGKMQLSSAFDRSFQQSEAGSDASSIDMRLEPGTESVQVAKPFCWVAPSFYHQPLYFEQPYLERFGAGPRRALQPWSAGLAFYSRVPLLPMAMFKAPPKSRDYTLGYRRPGDCVSDVPLLTGQGR